MILHNHLLTAIIIFILTYVTIVSEKINRTIIAMFGAVLMVIFQVMPQEHAIDKIDFNTIGLLIGMMIIVNILRLTGIFEYLAFKTAKIAKGDPWKIIISFSIITAVCSALLDNVTTVLLIAPVTFVITDTLNINPIPFLIPEILFANIGGTATLIGDPPNIMIGGATELSFLDFAMNLAPLVIVIFIVVIFILKFFYIKELNVSDKDKERIQNFNENKAIRDSLLLKKSLFILLLTLIGFSIHHVLGIESATVAIFGASLLLLISGCDPEEILVDIEWTTIFFFMGLFILVGALDEVGVIEILAKKMINLTHGDLVFTAIGILWLSAIASAFLDNIPFVATMIPLIKSVGALVTFNIVPLWWALALGACLGGNGSLVGASANVIVGGMAENKGYKLDFKTFIKVGFPIMLISIILSTIYLFLFYI